MDENATLKRLGDFELLREVGRGGMGIVYDARQVSLNRRVALKILPPGLGLTGQAVQRFEREAQAAAKLHHTNIVPVHAIGEEDGTHYYAMELIEGQALSEVLKDLSGSGSNRLMDATLTMLAGDEEQADPAPDQRQSSARPASSGITSLSDSASGSRKWFDVVARLIAEVADALEYANGRGVIHRDIKPANLMLSNAGKLCITDFGLARVAQEPGMTVSGSLMGTPAYMSPEQIASGRMKLDHRTDVYSLGAVLYEMLTHRRPFPGESREEILGGILTKEPRPPRRCNPRIPVDLETICQKAMEKDPDRRYATAGALADDLRQYLAHGLIKARRAGIAERSWKLVRRHPVKATVVLAVLIVVAASIAAWQAGGRAEIGQRLVADARLALREGTYREGLQFIDRALALDPGSVDARLVRARLLIVNYRMREATDEARLVLETEPQNYGAHAILASLALYPRKLEMLPDGTASWEYYHLNSIDPAPHLKVVEANAPESAEAHYLRALNTTNTQQRIELLDRALDLDPGDQLASVARMMALGDLQDHQLVLSEADRLIAARPKSAQGWRMKADAYRQQQDFDNAAAAIERAMEVDDLDPRNYLQRSWILRDKGEKDDALSDLTRSIELYPMHGYLYRNRADLLAGMGRFEEAIADARKSIELDPDNPGGFQPFVLSYMMLGREDELRALLDERGSEPDAWFDAKTKADTFAGQATLYLELGDLDRALAAVERAIDADPDAPWRALGVRVRIRKQLGDIEGVKTDCEEAVRTDPDTPMWLLVRGWTIGLEICDNTGAAMEDFDRAIALSPRWHFGYYFRSMAHQRLGHPDEALADLNRAIELGPYFPLPHEQRGLLYLRQGRYEEALADFGRAIELEPYRPYSHIGRGEVHEQLGDRDRAVADYSRAIEIAPSIPQSHYSRGGVYYDQGRFADALADYERATELSSDNAGYWASYGYSLFVKGALKEALTALDRALELHPRYAAVRADRGHMLAHLGRCDEAADEIRKAEEMALGQTWAHRNISEAHASFFYYSCPDRYDLTEALRHAQAAYEALPGAVRDIQALALLRKGDYAEAKRLYLELFEETPDGTSWFPLAMCLWHLGEKAEARRFYDRSVSWMDERLPDSPLYVKLRQEAAELLGVQSPGR